MGFTPDNRCDILSSNESDEASPGAVRIDGTTLSVDRVVSVARRGVAVEMPPEVRARMAECRESLEKLLAEGLPVYAVNTGVGDLLDVRIPEEDLRALQVNLIRSHACGVGPPLPAEVVRAMMLLRANALAKGYSAVRPELVELLVSMLNSRVHPVVPRQGSVGASGDLALLAHVALVMIGEGTAASDEGKRPGGDALADAGLEAVKLRPKEAISLINGTQAMTAVGCLAVEDSANLVDISQIAAAMSLEALKGTSAAFDECISRVRPHKGQAAVAGNMQALVRDSQIMISHKHCTKVQDAYTLRCVPQVIGATLDAVWHATGVLGIEINSATDNPLYFMDEAKVVSGGNFHGQPVALAMDYLGLAIHELGAFSERRLYRLLDYKLSGLPPFLTRHGGLSSGMMMPQYVAASIVSENKVLVHPASADSIPTSAGQEDHNSMGMTAAWKARHIVENTTRLIAIELLAAAQGLDFVSLSSSPPIESVRELIRSKVPRLDEDRPLTEDIDTIARMISEGVIVDSVEAACDFHRA
ncbi:MAG: histidine ammonia-lyase [Methanobacteriota archaeon]|nr:MAG: histidine ammonia-lyase [Euryarchaeota archaeon]